MVSRWGFRVETEDDSVRLTNTRYPHMLTAVNETLKAAYKNYNVNCGDFLTFCDFRALTNYKRTYEDMLVLLNDHSRAIAEQIIEYGLSLGIRPVKCTYFKRVEFKKKGKIVFILDVIKGKNLKINIGFAEIGGQAFDLIAKVVDQYEDKETFARFWRLANIQKYVSILDTVTSNVRENILNGCDCIECSNCKIRYKFTYRGEEYVKCSLGNFYVYNPKPDDIPSINAC